MSGPRLTGELRPPSDKSVTHRALLLAALASGRSVIRRPLDAADTRATAAAVAALGAELRWDGERAEVRGVASPRCPANALDCGNSGTTARLLSGLLAGHAGRWTLDGDDSLRRRPMGRVVEPLVGLGARIRGTPPTAAVSAASGAATAAAVSPASGAATAAAAADTLRVPLTIEGSALRGGEVLVEVPSAQVKTALMLAGLRAAAPLTVRQPVATRDHTERLFPRFGLELEVDPGRVTVTPGRPTASDLTVPGDPSSAAFAVVAALLLPGSRLVLRDVGLWPRRGGFLLALQQAGAPIEVLALRDVDGDPLADLHVESGRWGAFAISAADVPDLVDELPILALAAARAEGTSHFEGLAELRHKESDRLVAIAELLAGLGVPVELGTDSLAITGVQAFAGPPARVDHGDHRLALTAAVATLVTTGTLPDPPSAAVSWPTFAADLGRCLTR